YIAQLNASERLDVAPAGPVAKDVIQPALPPLRLFVNRLKEKLGAHAQVLVSSQTPDDLWINTRINTGINTGINADGTQGAARTYWYRISIDRMRTRFPGAWLGISALFAILALLGAYLIQLRINLPLQHLADAAGQLQLGQRPAPLPGDAPTEIATVSKSFNAMVKSLAEADDERAIMLAGISHDLRTPLTKLRLGLAMSPPADTALASSMERQINEMDAIIGQFIDFARLDDEAAELLDLNELVRELAQGYAMQGYRFALDLQDLPAMPLRPVAVRRMVGNLMENAVRYGIEGLEVQTRGEPDGISLSVLDRGPGVAPEHISRLTRPFVRTDEARSNNSGAGLGLAIVERLARQHGGSLHLELREGGGYLALLKLQLKLVQRTINYET
ncbi:MAG: ATP-binding protein, partial [Rugosibacter sp.]